MPEGTVKWHLNKARNELKEGFSMERNIGRLGLNPKQTEHFGHNGTPGTNGGPEYYFHDKLNLNIVYSVYYDDSGFILLSKAVVISMAGFDEYKWAIINWVEPGNSKNKIIGNKKL